jgi:hypothetical protein
LLQLPLASEYPEYYKPYVNLVPEGDLLILLKNNLVKTIELFESFTEESGQFRYAELPPAASWSWRSDCFGWF